MRLESYDPSEEKANPIRGFLQGKWLGHPLHPALVHVPVGLWTAACIADAASLLGYGGNALVRLSFFAILVGLVSALAAVPAGIADWIEIKQEKPAWTIGVYHMAINLGGAVLWALNLGLRASAYETAVSVSTFQLLLSVLGVGALMVGGYLGGRMVYDHGTSVARESKKRWRKVAAAGHAALPPE